MKNKRSLFLLPFLIFSLAIAACGQTSNSTSDSSIVEVDERRQIYDKALAAGYEGTYEEWLSSIRGADGTSIYNGTSNPADTVGNNGDTYINTTTWDIFVKTGGTWSKVGNIMGAKGDKGDTGEQGIPGNDGQDGNTPFIGENGNWWIGDIDTGIPATGPQGDTGETGADGISVVSITLTSTEGLVDTYTITYSNGTTSTFTVTNGSQGIQGIQGVPGQDGHTPVITIGENGNWIIDGVDTGIPATGPQGPAGQDGLSAYEIYISYYPGYPGTEQDWINDLAKNQLVKTVTYDFNGGSETEHKSEYFKGEPIGILPTTTKEYFVFEGWQLNEQIIDESYCVVDDMIISAKWVVAEGFISISSAEDLMNIKNNLSGYYFLNNNIDLAGIEWTPIGTEANPFNGVLLGQGYVIDNIRISSSHVYVGLFGYNVGTIKKLTLDNVDINVIGSLNNKIYAGSFVGYNKGVLSEAKTLIGDIYIKARSGNEGFVGGLIGFQDTSSDLYNLENNVNVEGDLTTRTGGIAGKIAQNASWTNIVNNGNVLSNNSYVGGLAASIENNIEFTSNNCSNTGNVFGANYVGGHFGYVSNSKVEIKSGFNGGEIHGQEDVGGLIGITSGGQAKIGLSHNGGNVLAESECVGGFIGLSYGKYAIKDSFNSATISGSSNFVGGLIGVNFDGNIDNSYNLGDVCGNGRFVGGIVGLNQGIFAISDSYNLSDISGLTQEAYGVGGIVGQTIGTSTIIERCFNRGNIFGPRNVGGLIGNHRGIALIKDSYNTGKIQGDTIVGGLLGGSEYYSVISNNTTIVNCYNAGEINAKDYVGGLIGQTQVPLYLYNSLNFGNVLAESDTVYLGGILGDVRDLFDIENIYYCSLVKSNNNIVEGTQFGTLSDSLSNYKVAFFITLLGWSTDVWDFTGLDVANGIYPTLKTLV